MSKQIKLQRNYRSYRLYTQFWYCMWCGSNQFLCTVYHTPMRGTLIRQKFVVYQYLDQLLALLFHLFHSSSFEICVFFKCFIYLYVLFKSYHLLLSPVRIRLSVTLVVDILYLSVNNNFLVKLNNASYFTNYCLYLLIYVTLVRCKYLYFSNALIFICVQFRIRLSVTIINRVTYLAIFGCF